MTRTVRLWVLVGLAALTVGVTSALAAWAGGDPSKNYPAGALPSACSSQPQGATCVNAGVYYLDQARAALKIGPYKLPANFATLTPAEQVFILANLDRIHYKLAPITGLTSALDRDALGGVPGDPLGVKGDGDPRPTGGEIAQFTSNWAGGLPNIVLAYEAWMYDDGYGSSNLDCTSKTAPGCWAHRHDVLWIFAAPGPSAMGAAAGKDKHGNPGSALLLGKGSSTYKPSYLYTWTRAVADGAGTHIYTVHKP